MSITSATGSSIGLFSALRGELDGFQRQLGTGAKAETYGGLGLDRVGSLDIRAKRAALDGYDGAIAGAATRLKVVEAALTRFVAMRGETGRNLLPGTMLPDATGRTVVRLGAEARLKEAIDLLNGDVAGRHVFAGRATDKAPVEGYDRIMDGDRATGRDGLKTLIAERKAADRGDGLGRLDLSGVSGTRLTLSESGQAGTRLNFGFLIQGASSTGSGAITAAARPAVPPTVTLDFPTQPANGEVVRVTFNQADGRQTTLDLTARQGQPGEGEFAIGATPAATTANLRAALGSAAVAGAYSVRPDGTPGALATTTTGGAPASIAFDVAAQPDDGDTLRVTLGLRDGTTATLTLTARTSPGAETNTFAIGTTPADTAAKLRSALAGALGRGADTALAAASATIAADDFFQGSPTPPSDLPRRIAGDPVTATGFEARASARKTVLWYRGDDAAPSARETAPVRIDATSTVGTGAQANEAPIRELLAGLGVLAAESFAPQEGERYLALAERVSAATALDPARPSLEGVAAEFGVAQAGLDAAKQRHATASAMLDEALSGIERADPQETATAILSLQTRLQASYQVTAMLSRLSLVNYL